MPKFLLILISTIVAGLIFFIPIILAIWLYFFYDRPINKLHKKISLDIPNEINQKNTGRGILKDEQERQVTIAQKPIKIELEIRESKRKLFLDRAHLISLFKLK